MGTAGVGISNISLLLASAGILLKSARWEIGVREPEVLECNQSIFNP